MASESIEQVVPVEGVEQEDPKDPWFKKYCPSRRKLYLGVSQLLVIILVCGTVWGMLKHQNLPVDKVFGLVLLAFTAAVFGKIFSLIHLPPLSGMIIAGFLFRNINFMSYDDDFSHKSSAILRNVALVIILMRAGLGLCPDTLKKMKMLIFRLAFVTSIAEAAMATLCSYYLLGLPLIWALMLAFLLCAVSPAIIVPCMFKVSDQRLGRNKNIPTLVIASASIDDIIAVTFFGILFGIQFSTGNFAWTLVKGPLEVLVGIAYGAVLGVVTWYIPHIENKRQIYYRVLVLLFGGMSVMFVSDALEFSGAGALGCLTLAFVAAYDWRLDEEQFPIIGMSFAVMWHFIQPFLFSLIGREIVLDQLGQFAGYGILCILIGTLFRILITPLVIYGGNFNFKEKVFLSITGVPKATVQAALGSVALDATRLGNYPPEYVKYSVLLLTIAVMSILITAPAGAMMINFSAPYLLHKTPPRTALDDLAPMIEEEEDDFNPQVRSQISINIL